MIAFLLELSGLRPQARPVVHLICLVLWVALAAFAWAVSGDKLTLVFATFCATARLHLLMKDGRRE